MTTISLWERDALTGKKPTGFGEVSDETLI